MHSLPNRLPARVSVPSLSTTWSFSLDVSLRSPPRTPRARNPHFLTIGTIAEARAIEIAKWALRVQIGGSIENIPSKLPQFLEVTIFSKSKSSKSKRDRNTINALAILLSKHQDFDRPACVVTEKNGISTINKAPKSKQRAAGSMKKWRWLS